MKQKTIQWNNAEDSNPLKDIEVAFESSKKDRGLLRANTLAFPKSILKEYNLTLEQLEKEIGAKILLF